MSLLRRVCRMVHEGLPGSRSTVSLHGDTLIVAFSHSYWHRITQECRYAELHIDRRAEAGTPTPVLVAGRRVLDWETMRLMVDVVCEHMACETLASACLSHLRPRMRRYTSGQVEALLERIAFTPHLTAFAEEMVVAQGGCALRFVAGDCIGFHPTCTAPNIKRIGGRACSRITVRPCDACLRRCFSTGVSTDGFIDVPLGRNLATPSEAAVIDAYVRRFVIGAPAPPAPRSESPLDALRAA